MAIVESLTADEIIARLAEKASSDELALALALVASLDSPAFTGNPTAPTPATSDNDTSIATTAFVKSAIALLVDSSPTALDTLNELAAALGDDPNFATTVTNALAAKAPLNSPAFTGAPTAPTPSPGDNDTSIATTAFIANAIQFMLSRELIELKGDMLVGSSNDTAGRLAIGTNDQVLTADSTAPLGMAWKDAASGGGGSYEYANSAEFLAETTTRDGTIAAPTGANWGADLGTGFPTSVSSGQVFVRTQNTVMSGVAVRTQWVTVGSSSNFPTGLTYSRRSVGGAAYSNWSSALYGATTPTGNYELTSKYYVDARSLTNLANWADLDTVQANQGFMGKVYQNDDLGTLTGITELGDVNEGDRIFESYGAYLDTTNYYTYQVQRVWVPRQDGSVVTISRRRNDYPSWTMGAWSAWKIERPDGFLAYPPITSYSSNWWAGPAQSGTRNLGGGTILYRPFVVGQPCRMTAFRMNVSTALAAATVSVGLYESDGGGPDGGALKSTLLNAADASTTGVKSTTGLTVDLESGLYYLGYLAVGGTVGVTAVTGTSDPLLGMYMPHREGSQGRIGGFDGDSGLTALPSVGNLPDTWDTNTAAPWYGIQTAAL